MDNSRELIEILVFDNLAEMVHALHDFPDSSDIEKVIGGNMGIWSTIDLGDLGNNKPKEDEMVGIVCKTAEETDYFQLHFPMGHTRNVFRFAPGLWMEVGKEPLPEDYSFLTGVLEH